MIRHPVQARHVLDTESTARRQHPTAGGGSRGCVRLLGQAPRREDGDHERARRIGPRVSAAPSRGGREFLDKLHSFGTAKLGAVAQKRLYLYVEVGLCIFTVFLHWIKRR